MSPGGTSRTRAGGCPAASCPKALARRSRSPSPLNGQQKPWEPQGLWPWWGRSLRRRRLQGPVPGAGHAAAGLLCWGRGVWGDPHPSLEHCWCRWLFPSSPHCRLPGNTTCQQNAVGLIKLPLLGISWSQAEVVGWKGDRPPVPSASERAVMLGLQGWKTVGCSSRAELRGFGLLKPGWDLCGCGKRSVGHARLCSRNP